jgi:hypothetical protein
MNTLFAQQQVPWPESSHWLLGLIGAAAAIGTLLWAWNQAKKAFGRTPPFHEEMEDRNKGLRSEIYHAKNSALKEIHGRIEPLERRIVRLEDNEEEMKADLVRKWGTLQMEIGEVKEDLAFIRGKFENGKSL